MNGKEPDVSRHEPLPVEQERGHSPDPAAGSSGREGHEAREARDLAQGPSRRRRRKRHHHDEGRGQDSARETGWGPSPREGRPGPQRSGEAGRLNAPWRDRRDRPAPFEGRQPRAPAGFPSGAPAGKNLPALLALLLGVALLLSGTVKIFLPFLAPIVIALVLTTAAYPLFAWIQRRVGEHRRGLASGLTCAALVVVVFVPVGWIVWSIASEAPSKEEVLKGKEDLMLWFEGTDFFKKSLWVQDPWHRVKDWAASADSVGGGKVSFAFLGEAATWIKSSVIPILSGTFQLFLKSCLMLFLLFFFFKDGPRILQAVKRQVPIALRGQEKVVTTFAQVSHSIIRGSFGTALAQGAVATVAYGIAGIPAVFWGVVTAFCALIPPLGTTLITVPIVAYLFVKASLWKCILVGVAAVGIGVLDNVLKPILMQDGLRVHSIWLLLAILGGINAFGPMGIIYGPMVLALLGTFLALLVRSESPTAGGMPSRGASLPGGAPSGASGQAAGAVARPGAP